MSPSALAIIDGDPFDRRTWSGASHHLLSALGRLDALEGAVDARPPAPWATVAKAAAAWPNRRRWRERYEFSPVRRAALSAYGGRRARAVNPSPDALLQIGAYFDFTRVRGLSPRLRCSYHDANLALYSREWTAIEDIRARHMRREWRAEQRVFDRLDLIMTMSEWLRRSLIDDFGQDPGKVVTVGSGANVMHLPEPTPRTWTPPRFLFVGLDWQRKGLPDVLAAFRRLRVERSDVELWVVGPAPPPAAHHEAGVTWHGRIDRSTRGGDATIERLHQDATAFVMPSLYDPMPNAFLEAMAYALPCIGSDVCAMSEMIDDGTTGLVVPARDADALLDAMRVVAYSPERARAMGEAGRRHLLEHYTWDSVAARMAAAIDRRIG